MESVEVDFKFWSLEALPHILNNGSACLSAIVQNIYGTTPVDRYTCLGAHQVGRISTEARVDIMRASTYPFFIAEMSSWPSC